MKYPDEVSYDLARYQQRQDEDDGYFKANKELMIEEEIYKMETDFCQDDLLSAINDASGINFTGLFTALKAGEANECLFVLQKIRDDWIKKTATDTVENS